MLGESCDMNWRPCAESDTVEELYSSCTGVVAVRVPRGKEGAFGDYFKEKGFPIVAQSGSRLVAKDSEDDPLAITYVLDTLQGDDATFTVAYKKAFHDKQRWG
jgi:hypothetical protein